MLFAFYLMFGVFAIIMCSLCFIMIRAVRVRVMMNGLRCEELKDQREASYDPNCFATEEKIVDPFVELEKINKECEVKESKLKKLIEAYKKALDDEQLILNDYVRAKTYKNDLKMLYENSCSILQTKETTLQNARANTEFHLKMIIIEEQQRGRKE